MRPSWLNVPQHTPPQWLQPPQMRWQRPSAYRRAKMKLNEKPRYGSLLLAGTLLLAVTLLSGCQTQPTVPCVAPAIPTAPVSQMQTPSRSYSADVLEHFKTWEKLLTDGTMSP